MTPTHLPQIEAIAQLISTVHLLRAPGGCPWDRAQTHQTLRQYLIEEAYEVLDVLDEIGSSADLEKEKIRSSFREELGDLFMQVLLHSEMASETKAFDIYDVAQTLNEKLIRRHPHVFQDRKQSEGESGGAKTDTEEVALQRWEKEKAKEKASRLDASILDGVPRGMPALQKAARILEKVTRVGFQWKDLEGPFDKVEEEWAELKVEIQQLEKSKLESKENTPSPSALKKVESEMGDLLFTLCNLSYLLKINPEDALRGTLSRFQNRFRHVERRLKEMGKSPDQSHLEEMDEFWSEAKKIEKTQVWGLTGRIAAGKSTVARFLSEHGIPIIDADLISRELMQSNETVRLDIFKKWGTLDRTQLRDLVFKDPEAKAHLESILHPLIQAESNKRIRELAGHHTIIVYEAALLIETGRHEDLAGLIVVESSDEIQLKRLLERPTMTLETAERILKSQLTNENQKRHADQTIQNTGSLEVLRQKVKTLITELKWI